MLENRDFLFPSRRKHLTHAHAATPTCNRKRSVACKAIHKPSVAERGSHCHTLTRTATGFHAAFSRFNNNTMAKCRVFNRNNPQNQVFRMCPAATSKVYVVSSASDCLKDDVTRVHFHVFPHFNHWARAGSSGFLPHHLRERARPGVSSALPWADGRCLFLIIILQQRGLTLFV